MAGRNLRELEMLDDRAEGQHREKGERTEEQNRAGEQRNEQTAADREARKPGRNTLLFSHISGDREHGDDWQETSEHHVCGERQRIEDRMRVRVRGEPSERATVVA